MDSPISQHFWLICGLWCGIGNGLYVWFRLRKKVAPGIFSEEDVVRFSKGLAFWILVPSLILWGLQLSIGTKSTPEFFRWPSPQKQIALALQVFVWSALIFWVFLRDGATTLSVYYGAVSRSPSFLHSPIAIKCGAVAAVLAGLFALLSVHA